MAESKGPFSADEVLREVDRNVKSLCKASAKQEQWVEDHEKWMEVVTERANSHAKRIRIMEIVLAGIVGIPSTILLLNKIGVLKF